MTESHQKYDSSIAVEIFSVLEGSGSSFQNQNETRSIYQAGETEAGRWMALLKMQHSDLKMKILTYFIFNGYGFTRCYKAMIHLINR